MKLSALREQRSAKVAAMKSLVDAAATEGRDLSADETQQFDALKAEERTLAAQVERAEYLAEVERRSAAAPVSGNDGADFQKLARDVSVMKVMRAQMEGRSLDGVEAEYAQEAERRSGRKAQGAFVPLAALETRANETGTASEIVPADHRADQYIPALRNRLLARRLGVRVLSGLSGDVKIPKHGTGLATGWVTEGGAVPEGEMTFGEVTLSPKHVGGKTEMSRQLIQQSSPDIEALIRGDLSALIAQQIDAAILNGAGATGEPQGIIGTTGVQTANIPQTWNTVLGLSEMLELENLEGAAWLTTPTVRTTLGSTEKVSGSGSGFLLENGQMDGKPFWSTNQMPADKLIFGDWSQVLLGIWSEIDILVNPYAEPAYSRGGVQVRAMATADVALRHPQAFVVATTQV
ncbi:phage major capsid protein [Halomonas ventosae]|uniref:HK97 family phage major capsid protein n=1 Tax=Halomonas ventosae TaxID=229007 RepID=A0A2T0VL63_9GAMM|nr:phage major capsid protein [Halomonas ventosae]PRY70989.1 HK97 family phage major capsid protein [Halomonas ventosae]